MEYYDILSWWQLNNIWNPAPRCPEDCQALPLGRLGRQVGPITCVGVSHRAEYLTLLTVDGTTVLLLTVDGTTVLLLTVDGTTVLLLTVDGTTVLLLTVDGTTVLLLTVDGTTVLLLAVDMTPFTKLCRTKFLRLML
jgi:hypothetical protein